MKRSTIILIIIAIVLLGTVIIIARKLFWQPEFSSNVNQQQTAKKIQEARAVQQAAAVASKSQRTLPAPKVSSLIFDNQQQSLATDTEFALKALIEPKGKKVSASELHVIFDPKILKLESIVPSDEFSLVLAESQIDNNKGIASIVLGVPLEKPPVDSISPIATFNFQTLSVTGQTKVSFTDKSGAAAEGTMSNIISSLEPATVIVQ